MVVPNLTAVPKTQKATLRSLPLILCSLSLMKLQQEHFQLAELEEPLQTCWTDLQAIWAETAR